MSLPTKVAARFFTTTTTTKKDYLSTQNNIRITFADLDNSGTVTTTEILQQNHYYPFGANIEGLTTTSPNKYQYNGKEWNADFGLEWNDYGARFYDPWVGRWWGVDAMSEKYLMISPFAYVNDNPISLYDPNGMEIEWDPEMSRSDKRAIKKQIRSLRKHSETFNEMWKSLKASTHYHCIKAGVGNQVGVLPAAYSEQGSSTDITLDPRSTIEGIPPEIGIAHEIGHAWRFDQGLESVRNSDPNLSPSDDMIAASVHDFKRALQKEYETTHIENIIRAEVEASTGKDYGVRKKYGDMLDFNASNTKTLFGIKRLDYAKGTIVGVPRTVPDYNYKGNNHYNALKERKANVGSLTQTSTFK